MPRFFFSPSKRAPKKGRLTKRGPDRSFYPVQVGLRGPENRVPVDSGRVLFWGTSSKNPLRSCPTVRRLVWDSEVPRFLGGQVTGNSHGRAVQWHPSSPFFWAAGPAKNGSKTQKGSNLSVSPGSPEQLSTGSFKSHGPRGATWLVPGCWPEPNQSSGHMLALWFQMGLFKVGRCPTFGLPLNH